MKRLLIIAASLLTLSACSHMGGMEKHHDNNYAKLAKIAKQENSQFALLLNHKGELSIVDVDTGKLVPPGITRKPTAEEGMSGGENKVSDEEFERIKRHFDSTIKVEVSRGSVCITFAKEPPGKSWTICW